ncbi:beta-galactosidase [Thermococcus barossii]|uniref:beta-galactosidase n=1 Tax=Thermococcus barossii TaxID=54077 RepID=UPI0012FDEFE7|nr:beta-galactosidase [Thermococcus barossii]
MAVIVLKKLFPAAFLVALLLASGLFLVNRNPELPPCENNVTYSLSPDVNGSLGVLVVYMDPGISHERAEAVFDAARDVGAKWVRIGFIWAIAEPSPGEYNFTEFDWIINAALQRNLLVLPVVMFTPRWASERPDARNYYLYPPSNPEYLREFARALAAHYRGRVTHWELWNEPDMAGFLKDPDGDGSTADDYAEMLAHFYRGIKEGNSSAKVVLGGLANSKAEPSCEGSYLRKLLSDPEFPAGRNFDVMNVHTNFRNPWEIVEEMREIRTVLQEFGLEKPIWVTETSYTPVKRFQILPCYRGEEGFERYVHNALVVELNEGAEVAFWAALHDYGGDRPESDPYKYSGLYTYDLKPKGAAEVFRNLSEELAVNGSR